MKTLLFVSLGSEEENALFDWTLQQATLQDAKLVLLKVLPEINLREAYLLGELQPERIEADQTHWALEDLKTLQQKANDKNVPCDILCVRGKGFYQTIQQVLKFEADLVIKCVTRPNHKAAAPFWFVSDDWHLLRKCPCPVLLHRANVGLPFEKVLVTVDLDLDADQADPLNSALFEWAKRLHSGDAPLKILHAMEESTLAFLQHWDTDLEQETLQRLAHQETHLYHKGLEREINAYFDRDYPLAPQLSHGPVEDVVANTIEQDQTQLVVMGTLGRQGLSGMVIGNTAENILQQTPCSVLAIKPDDFETPIQLEE